MWNAILDFLFPRIHSLDESIQKEMLRMHVFPVQWKEKELRRRGMKAIDSLTAPCSYADAPFVQRALHQFKYRSIPSLAIPLGSLLNKATPLIALQKDSVLTPVPLYWMRRFSRGFNQSQLLAEEVCNATNIPIMECLTRVRHTGRQAMRNREERLHALHDAFRVTKNFQAPSHVILIDDVATTGSTLDACAHVLKNAGVMRVDALTVAIKV